MDESTVVPCASHSPLNLTSSTGSDSQAGDVSDLTKGVQQQASSRHHRMRLRATLVVGEMIFRLHESKYNIQPTDRTRAPKEREKEEGRVPDLAPSDTQNQWSCSGSVLEKPKKRI